MLDKIRTLYYKLVGTKLITYKVVKTGYLSISFEVILFGRYMIIKTKKGNFYFKRDIFSLYSYSEDNDRLKRYGHYIIPFCYLQNSWYSPEVAKKEVKQWMSILDVKEVKPIEFPEYMRDLIFIDEL